MQRIAWIGLGIVLGIGAAHSWLWPTPEICEYRAPGLTQQLTAGGHSANVAASSVDDAVLLKRLTDEAAALIGRGESVDAQVLAKQLEFDKCSLNLPEPAAKNQDTATLYHDVKDSIVVVSGLYKCPRCDEWHASPASGFVLTSDGAIATSRHVISELDKNKTFVVMTADGHVYPVQKVLASNAANDVVILKIDAQELKPLPLASAAPVGAAVHVISHPAARFYSLSSGVISRYTRVRMGAEPVEALQITADFARGSSGAPVLNAQGQVVGIVRSTESIYYSIESGQQKNLQMVLKLCTPAQGLRQLIGT